MKQELWNSVPKNKLVEAIKYSSDNTREEIAENVRSII